MIISYHIFINYINSINAEVKRQLYFDFKDGWAPQDEFDPKRLLDSFKVTASVPSDSIILGISFNLRVSQSEEDLLYIEKFLHSLDDEFDDIGLKLVSAVREQMDKAVKLRELEIEEFREGAQAKPVIEELKMSGQPDVKRLALWVEFNWDNFTNAEKEVAYYSFLLPAQRDGDYVHKDSSDTPRFWDSIMQSRLDTDISYRWKGSSMKDVMPYTDPDAMPGQDPNYGTPTVAQLERLFLK